MSLSLARFVMAILVAAWPSAALAQAVSTWTSPTGVPLAVLEVPGGDVEHLVAIVPPGTPAAATVIGFPVAVETDRNGQAFALSVPVARAGAALGALAELLAPVGSAAVVALGPVPARELLPVTDAFDAVPLAALPRARCVLADGATAIERGQPERVELRFPLPAGEDARANLEPALLTWLEETLRSRFPDVAVRPEARAGCARLVVAAPAGDESVRSLLDRLRAAIARAVAAPIEPATATAVAERIRRRQAAVLRDGRGATLAAARRLAAGGDLAGLFGAGDLDAAALARLAGQLLGGRSGEALVVEAERRAVTEGTTALDNGVTLQARWLPGDNAALAAALGGMEPAAAERLAQLAAARLAGAGWATEAAPLGGVWTVAAAVPAGETVAALEALAIALTGEQPTTDDWAGAWLRSLGLVATVAPESLSLALSLPVEAEEAREAAEKFFSSLAPGGVVAAGAAPAAGLDWRPSAGAAELVAAVELPASPAGWLAGAVLIARAGALPAAGARWLAAPGRLLLEIRAAGADTVPALDARLAEAWRAARAKATDEELRAASLALGGALFGDATRATARLAAEPLLPALPTPTQLGAVGPDEVAALLRSLPAWEQLSRHARGPAPVPATPPPVRKSRPSRG